MMEFQTVAELSSFQMVKSTSVTSVMELRTVKEATVGLMAANTLVNFAKGSSMDSRARCAHSTPPQPATEAGVGHASDPDGAASWLACCLLLIRFSMVFRRFFQWWPTG